MVPERPRRHVPLLPGAGGLRDPPRPRRAHPGLGPPRRGRRSRSSQETVDDPGALIPGPGRGRILCRRPRDPVVLGCGPACGDRDPWVHGLTATWALVRVRVGV